MTDSSPIDMEEAKSSATSGPNTSSAEDEYEIVDSALSPATSSETPQEIEGHAGPSQTTITAALEATATPLDLLRRIVTLTSDRNRRQRRARDSAGNRGYQGAARNPRDNAGTSGTQSGRSGRRSSRDGNQRRAMNRYAACIRSVLLSRGTLNVTLGASAQEDAPAPAWPLSFNPEEFKEPDGNMPQSPSPSNMAESNASSALDEIVWEIVPRAGDRERTPLRPLQSSMLNTGASGVGINRLVDFISQTLNEAPENAGTE